MQQTPTSGRTAKDVTRLAMLADAASQPLGRGLPTCSAELTPTPNFRAVQARRCLRVWANQVCGGAQTRLRTASCLSYRNPLRVVAG